MPRLKPALILTLALCACDVPAIAPLSDPQRPRTASQIASAPPPLSAPISATQMFSYVVSAVQPVATRECHRRTTQVNCDFQVVIDPRKRARANAYQSVDETGRPVLTFTRALINQVQNPDELAFILSHEAAHHVLRHLSRQAQNADAGAETFADLATLTGGSAADVASAQKLGAAVGAYSYTKEFELEADELGTIITHRAGYNPLIGAQFFTSFSGPASGSGPGFFSTHPPNAERLDLVRRTSARLGVPG